MEKHASILINAGKKFLCRNTNKEDSEARAKFTRERVVGLESESKQRAWSFRICGHCKGSIGYGEPWRVLSRGVTSFDFGFEGIIQAAV